MTYTLVIYEFPDNNCVSGDRPHVTNTYHNLQFLMSVKRHSKTKMAAPRTVEESSRLIEVFSQYWLGLCMLSIWTEGTVKVPYKIWHYKVNPF